MCTFFLYLFLTFLSDFIIVTINLIQLLAATLIRINYLSINLYLSGFEIRCVMQVSHEYSRVSHELSQVSIYWVELSA